MRRRNGGVWRLAEIIVDDLEGQETGLSKPQDVGDAPISQPNSKKSRKIVSFFLQAGTQDYTQRCSLADTFT